MTADPQQSDPEVPTSRVEEIFHALLEAPDNDTEARVIELCGGDRALESEVRELLAAHFGSGDLLQQPALDLPEILAERPGDRIAAYVLVRLIGEGGFGVVWEAVQEEPIRRKVALKLVKPGMDSREVLARFEAERQALAIMDHPYIAHVFDAGATDNGRPYFVMELVDGVPITEFCDRHSFDVGKRLELFRNVCSAIGHAHLKGVVHRDIKPSNVLVSLKGGIPEVKVIDFGVAKAIEGKLTDRTLFTRVEQFLGTPIYMSPEQAAAGAVDIDTRSDIYSLGVLLYELIAGRPPFDAKTLAKAGYDEMRRIIRETDPPKPSSRVGTVAADKRIDFARGRSTAPEKLDKSIDADLDWIVMKAIEKDRDRRYVTAEAFADDVTRFLRHEPVLAAAPGTGYRLRKFARRNRVAISFAATVAILQIGGAVAIAWQAVRAKSEARRAQAAEGLAARSLADSETARQDAEGIVSFLTEILESPNPDEDKGGREVKVADVLDRAVRQLDGKLLDQPGRRAALLKTIAESYGGLGLYADAAGLWEEVLDYMNDEQPPNQEHIIAAMTNLSSSQLGAGWNEKALATLAEVRPLAERHYGPEHEIPLAQLQLVAECYMTQGKYQERLEILEDVLPRRRRMFGDDHQDTLETMRQLAITYGELGRWKEALELGQKVYDKRLALLGEKDRLTLLAMNSLVNFYQETEAPREAVELGEKQLALCREVYGEKHRNTLAALMSLASAYGRIDRVDKALPLSRQAYELFVESLGREHPQTIGTLGNLATSLRNAGRVEEAVKLFEEVLELYQAKNYGPDNPDVLRVRGYLAKCYGDLGDPERSLKIGHEVLEGRRKLLGDDHPALIATLNGLGMACQALDRDEEALEYLKETVRIAKTAFDPNHPATIKPLYNTARANYKLGRYDVGIPMMEEALRLSRETNGETDRMTIMSLEDLGLAYSLDNQPELAIERWEAAVKAGSVDMLLRFRLGVALSDKGDYEAAVPHLRAAHEGLPETSEDCPECLERLITALKATDREAEAVELGE